jgi:TatD DNase family protein
MPRSSIALVDTHCHIHEALEGVKLDTETRRKYQKAGFPSPDHMMAAAHEAGVVQLICVGTTLEDSELAVRFVAPRGGAWASIGIHPHEAKLYADDTVALKKFAALAARPKVVAVGECGLDFYYNHSSPVAQEKILRFQLELALKHDLPVIFHVRDAFSDFWPIFDDYKGLRGVIHSFSAGRKELDQILQRNLHVGLNGIMTFTKDSDQLAAAKAVPLDKLLLETDAPFLTPSPHRGTLCEPKHVRVTAEFLSELRAEPLDRLAARTTENAQKLFVSRIEHVAVSKGRYADSL